MRPAHPTGAASPDAPRSHLYSKLYCRLNGFLFGVFFQMCRFRLARENYPFYRRRMQLFLDEIGVAIEVPAQHAEFVAWNESIAPELGEAFSKRPFGLVDFLFLGVSSVDFRQLLHRNQPAAAATRDAAKPLLARYGIGRDAFDVLTQGSDRPAKTVDEVVSPALRLLVLLIRDLKREFKTCFIAMPFRAPFEGYYATFYRPLLADLGYRCVRAWGGLGLEDFSPSLVAAILKSGAMLADISGRNPNVTWEVGVAQGAAMPVLLVRDAERPVPADLARHVSLSYARADAAAGRIDSALPARAAMILAALRRLDGDAIRLASGLRGEDIDSASKWMIDIFTEMSLRGARKRRGSDADERIDRGFTRLEEQRWDEAVIDFEYALQHGGDAVRAHGGRAAARLRQGRLADAERDLSFTIARGAPAHATRALVRVGRGRLRLALRDLHVALAIDRNDLDARQLRPLVAVHLGELAVAQRDVQFLRRREPTHPATLGAEGWVQLAQRDFAAAAASFRAARRRAAGSEWNLEPSLALLLAGDFEAAAREREKGLLRAADAEIENALRALAHWPAQWALARRPEFRTALAAARKRLAAVHSPFGRTRAATT